MNDNPHQPCPYVDCGSSDAFNWHNDGYGYCHSCGESYPSKTKLSTFDWVQHRYPVKRRVNVMDIEVNGMTFDGIRSIDPEVCKFGDQGKPIVESNPENKISQIYLDLANKIKSNYFKN